MRQFILLLFLTSIIACKEILKTKAYIPDASQQIAKIDQLIAERDHYKYRGDGRFPPYYFNKSAFETFDSSKFLYSLVTSYYDTLTKKITRVSVYSYMDTLSGPAQIDDFYYDDSNQLIKIDIAVVNTSPEDFALYYFNNHNLVYQKTKNIEIKNLKLYLLKVDNIYKKILQSLSEKKFIHSA